MYSEIKYDGERVQVHKNGDHFSYFSRSLKPVLPHKVCVIVPTHTVQMQAHIDIFHSDFFSSICFLNMRPKDRHKDHILFISPFKPLNVAVSYSSYAHNA